MLAGKKILAIIPARGGSKGIPDKNIKRLGGKPLIAWTIEAALHSVYIDSVIVSTDSEQIADIARQCGAELPFLRPDNLAHDEASASDVIIHAIEFLQHDGDSFDFFVYLQPTSPFRNHLHIDKALEDLFSDRQAQTLVAVKEVSEQPGWMKILSPEGYLKNLIQANSEHVIRQKLEITYILNGAIFISSCPDYLIKRSFYWGNTKPFLMDYIASIDIDTFDDWRLAEYFLPQRSIDPAIIESK